MRRIVILIVLLMTSSNGAAERTADSDTSLSKDMAEPKAIYLGNEGVLVQHKNRKILFDPFFHNSYNNYQLVPEAIRDALFNGKPPYHNIDAIFISHAHGDHFAAIDLHKFLTAFPGTFVVAPKQAIDQIVALSQPDKLKSNIQSPHMISIDLAYQDPPHHQSLPGVSFDAVRIPHAGWPQRADVSNIVFRVSLENELTVIHMGDADTDDEHYKPLINYWDSQTTNTAFPPYWFLTSKSGQFVLSERIKATHNVGVHVPIKVPNDLKESGGKYFTIPGEELRLMK